MLDVTRCMVARAEHVLAEFRSRLHVVQASGLCVLGCGCTTYGANSITLGACMGLRTSANGCSNTRQSLISGGKIRRKRGAYTSPFGWF